MRNGLVISLLLLLALLASSCTGSPEQGESVAVERETANATHEATSDEMVNSTAQTIEGDPVQSGARAAGASRGKPGSARAQAPRPNNPAVPNAKGFQIAFSGEGGIEVISADGSDRRRLGPGADPGWSRDGKLIAYVTGGDGGEIRVVNADGSGLWGLGIAGFSPTWSPDGGQLAFGRDCHGHQSRDACSAERATWPTDPAEDCGPECGIGLVARDGTGVRHLGEGIWPEWGPDGRIIFADGVPTEPCYYDQGYAWTRGTTADSEGRRMDALPPCELPLWVMKADGSGRSRLPIEKAIRPTWSHDGRRIAYATARDGVFIANSDGTAIRKVAPAGYSQPSWSPDGLWLALKRQTTSDYQGEGHIYLRTIDGSTEIRLTSGRWDSQPAFSPPR